MNELDDLRAVLRARADLAPDSDGIVPATHQRVRMRRARRRTVALAGVVVATVAGLAAVSLIRFGPANSAATPPLTPSLPFTVGHLPPGYQLDMWRIQSQSASVDYRSGSELDIQIQELPVHPADTAPQNAIQGQRGVVITRVTRQVGPSRWIAVAATAAVTQQTVQEVADSVTTRPSTPPSLLHVGHVPPGFTVQLWMGTSNQGGTESLWLCPPPTPYTSGQADSASTMRAALFGNPCVQLDLFTFHSTVATEQPDGQPTVTHGVFRMAAQIDPLHRLVMSAPADQSANARAVFESVSTG
jgi:hypothetical protein